MRSVSVAVPDGHPQSFVLLSPRETEITRLVASGLANKEIADKLALTEGTVKQYVTNLMAALGLHCRMDLLIWAMSHQEALNGAATNPEKHPIGCGCPQPYCSAMREPAE